MGGMPSLLAMFSTEYHVFVRQLGALSYVLPSSRASPLPQVFAVSAEFDSGTKPVGAGLARDEARADTAKFAVNPA